MCTCVACGNTHDKIEFLKFCTEEYMNQHFNLAGEMKQLKLNTEEKAVFQALAVLTVGEFLNFCRSVLIISKIITVIMIFDRKIVIIHNTL